jgi:C4-dicarboxylate-binding protein DctP
MQPSRRMLTAFLIMLLANGTAGAAGRQIRIALQLPEHSHLFENLDLFKQLVEKGTNGAYEIVIAHSGRLIKEQDAPEAVATGAAEMASVAVNQYAGVIPATDLFVQPFMFSHPPTLLAATQPGSPVRAPIDQAILAQVGARVLWWQSNGTTVMVSKAAPATTPAAIAGKAVRVSTESEAEFIRLCGGIARVLPAAAAYAAYQTGEVVAGSTTIGAVPVRKLWEVTRFVTYTRHRTAEFVVTINERLWQSLPAEHRRVFESAAHEAEVRLRARVAEIDREAHALAERNGMKLLEVTGRELQDQWKFCAAPMLDAYLDRSGELGARVIAGYRKILLETQNSSPFQLVR